MVSGVSRCECVLNLPRKSLSQYTPRKSWPSLWSWPIWVTAWPNSHGSDVLESLVCLCHATNIHSLRTSLRAFTAHKLPYNSIIYRNWLHTKNTINAVHNYESACLLEGKRHRKFIYFYSFHHEASLWKTLSLGSPFTFRFPSKDSSEYPNPKITLTLWADQHTTRENGRSPWVLQAWSDSHSLCSQGLVDSSCCSEVYLLSITTAFLPNPYPYHVAMCLCVCACVYVHQSTRMRMHVETKGQLQLPFLKCYLPLYLRQGY